MTHALSRSFRGLALALALAAAPGGCGKQAAEDGTDRPGPVPAVTGLGPEGQLQIGPDDRCPVCAMRPHERPRSAAGLAVDDGRTFYFCGNGCLLRAWLHPEVHLGVDRSSVTRLVVVDYFTGHPLDARDAHWIAGSDVTGPMGAALVPLATAGDADAFVKRHGAKHRFRLTDLDDARWQAITGRPALRPDESPP